jgi:hypothetical protein
MRTSILALIGLTSFIVKAQTPLPYSTGFDNAAEQLGWQEFRTGHLSNYSWDFSNIGNNAPSSPNVLWHDYPVGGSETDTVQDWLVSPPFNFASGGSLAAMKVMVYSIMGSATPVDELKIFLLTGSNDPDDATTITELDDLTDMVSSSLVFVDLPAVPIPATPGTSYLALRYQATNNWFTIQIDDIEITGAPEGIGEEHAEGMALSLYPDPAVDVLNVSLGGERVNASALVFDAAGKQVLLGNVRHGMIDVAALSSGSYVLQVNDGSQIRRATFTKQ